ncbi:phenylalanine--tRNA ligase subunit beta [Candidatus Nomurabacteria bacterium]|nr:phenylalanine--tRNA ligase subunit beta [Candidatus Nomurabacteria bacterium]
MKVSLNTIKQLIDFELPPVDELVERINAQLGGVEEIISLSEKYKDAKIVKVVECEKHANADKLSVCKIDDGGDELTQVVCGAPNVHAGMWAVWLPPESIVPSTFDDEEPFKLGARELRGEMSHGMLASAKELALGDDHNGIVEITKKDLPAEKELSVGASFAEVFGLDDTIIDIENKMFTHRPDLFGQLGVAREIAGIFGYQFDDPKWYYELDEQPEPSNSFELKSFNDCEEKVSRLMFVGMDNVTIAPSPLWLQAKLVSMGSKSINNVVDVTNYVMLMTSQPTHAYDYDKLRGESIGARMANSGEKITLINGKSYELSSEDIVIADAEGAIGLGGIMGGSDSEVSNETTRIVFECANFDMYTVRKASMRYGLFTDALTRFNKGQSMLMNPYVTQFALNMLSELSGAKLATEIYDDLKTSDDSWRAKPTVIPMPEAKEIERDFINSRLGLDLSVDDMMKLVTNVGFECEGSVDSFSYWAPAWRMDIQDKEDVVEEIGRLYGFDKLPRELPARSTKPAQLNESTSAKQSIREKLKALGANEVLTYSFVHEDVMKKSDQDVNQAFRLSNALSPDLQYYRLSVLPSLLDKVHANIKSSHDEFILYEIGKGHNKKYHTDDDEGLPGEMEFVDMVYTSKKPKSGAAYYHVRNLIQQLCLDLGFTLRYKPVEEELDYPVTAPFDLKRSALLETQDGVFIGMIGELKQSVIKNFKLPSYTAAATLDFEGLKKAIHTERQTYLPLSKYPSVSQDLSLKVSSDVSFDSLFSTVSDVVSEESDNRSIKIDPVAIYQPADDHTVKTITLRITVSDHEKTLTDRDVSEILNHAAGRALSTVGAVLS